MQAHSVYPGKTQEYERDYKSPITFGAQALHKCLPPTIISSDELRLPHGCHTYCCGCQVLARSNMDLTASNDCDLNASSILVLDDAAIEKYTFARVFTGVKALPSVSKDVYVPIALSSIAPVDFTACTVKQKAADDRCLQECHHPPQQTLCAH